jgi:AcrR family transcriptional regulator
MSHIERRLRAKEEMKQSILDAARNIAAKEGWQAVTIRKIADEIEYTPPIVYEYFENKEALFKELIYFGFRMMHKDIEKAKNIESDPKKMLFNIGLICWDFAFSHTDLFQLMFSLERPTPSEEMVYFFSLTESIFMELSKNNKVLSQDLLLSWICLNHGAISILMQFPPVPPQFIKKDPRELYISIIQRFISNI